MTDMWPEFSAIINNPEEMFFVDIYRYTNTVSLSGEVSQTYKHIGNTNSLWLYPQETGSVIFEGNAYTVDTILLFKPEVSFKRGDVFVCSHRPDNLLRCVGIIDLKSHKEAMCYSPHDLSMAGIEKSLFSLANTRILG
jgi:hypothetical protein